MKNLSTNWLTEGLIDFEYKKYQLLDYLQTVNLSFQHNKLYPSLQDLVFHYRNLLDLDQRKNNLKNNFPGKISSIDFSSKKIKFEPTLLEDKSMTELQDIISFSIPEFKRHILDGKEKYEYFENKINISPIGLTPLYPDEGYLFISELNKKETRIYEYQISSIHNLDTTYKSVYTSLIEVKRRSISETYENMKISLIAERKKYPNPATYLLESNVNCPLNETLLPIAKRILVRYVSSFS